MGLSDVSSKSSDNETGFARQMANIMLIFSCLGFVCAYIGVDDEKNRYSRF